MIYKRHLPFLHQVTHNSSTVFHHLDWSCTTFQASSHDKWKDASSFSADLLQVILGLPHYLLCTQRPVYLVEWVDLNTAVTFVGELKIAVCLNVDVKFHKKAFPIAILQKLYSL